MCPLLSVLAERVFSLAFSFFQCSHVFLGTAVNILQIEIVLLRCTVNVLLFYLDFTNALLALPSYIQQ